VKRTKTQLGTRGGTYKGFGLISGKKQKKEGENSRRKRDETQQTYDWGLCDRVEKGGAKKKGFIPMKEKGGTERVALLRTLLYGSPKP